MTDHIIDPRAQAVLDFWFGAPADPDHRNARKAWFVKDDAFDALIRARFQGLHGEASARRLDRWRTSALGCLALVVVLDQFSRNMYRGTPAAFACDPYALELAEHAVDSGLDATVHPVHRMFFYLPFEHSESLAQQARSVALFERLRGEPQLADSIPYAQKHYDVIARFGRFPHRNAILGRPSTPDESIYLSQPGAGF